MRPDRPSTMIAIASSAGGLAALTRVLEQFRADIPAAVLVVQHLDPRHDSRLAEILNRRTELRVIQAEEGMRIAEGRVATAPPDHHLLANSDGTVSLTRSELAHFVRPSADLLFESAAAAYGPDAIAVVLSGTGKDGALGAAAIKQMGGTVIVSNLETSEFFGMPGAAIALGCVDEILPIDEIPARLDALARRDRRTA